MQVEKKYVNVSVVMSNIKSKKGSYFGRVCKEGRIGGKELLQELKKVAPYIDISMVQAGLEKLADIVFDAVAGGFDVDFFNLGTFSLATCGQLEIKNNINGYAPDAKDALSGIDIEDEACNESCKDRVVTKCGNYDISEAIGKNVKFQMKFTQSKAVKESLKNVAVHHAIKKKRAPVVKKIDFPIPQSSPTSPSFVKIKGDGLKLMGDSCKIGIYIDEKSSNTFVKIPKTAIIENTPKSLLFMVEHGLKKGVKYNLKIVTQYRSGGGSSLLRMGEAGFIYECATSPSVPNVPDVLSDIKAHENEGISSYDIKTSMKDKKKKKARAKRRAVA